MLTTAVSALAICAMILLKGDKNYQQNWLYFSDILIFSPATTGEALYFMLEI
jgi:hypothetical protein